MGSGSKLRALAVSLVLITSAVTGLVAFTGTAAAANTADLDFAGIYNADVVRGTADATDGDFDNGGYTLVSSSAATSAADGLPDDGVIPEQTDVHPEFDLADFNSADSNAWQTTGTGEVTADLTDGKYATVHVVASAGGAGTGSPARFEIDLHYADGSTETSSEFTVPDWFGSPPSDPGYAVRDGMDRYDTGTNSYEEANEPGIWGYAVSADSGKTLTQVTIDVTENQAGSFNFFGGVATTETSNVLNGAPTASADSASTNEDSSVTVDVVSNDGDPDGDALDVSQITSGPAHGTATITGASNDKIEFDPGTDRTGDVSIGYEVSDGNGGTDTATLSVTVNAVNDAPTASADSATTNEDTSVTVDVVSNDNDVDGDALDVTTITSGPGHGTATITGPSSDSIQFTPGANETGAISISYEVSDGNGATDTGTLSATVNSVNDAPSITLGANQTHLVTTSQRTVSAFATGFTPGGGADEQSQAIEDFIVTASDPDGILASVDVTDGDNDGVGTLTYSSTGEAGSATVSVKVVDDGGTARGGSDTSAAESFTIASETVSVDPNLGRTILRTTDSGGDGPDTTPAKTTIVIERVSIVDPTVRAPVDIVSERGLRVTDVFATFEEGTVRASTLTVEVHDAPPTDVPAAAGDGTLGYVTVEFDGFLEGKVATGSFLVRFDDGAVDTAEVVAERYHDGAWETVETMALNATAVRIDTPGYSTFAVRVPMRSNPRPTESPDVPQSPTPPATSQPVESPDSGPDSPRPSPTSAPGTVTPGASGPGFSALTALSGLVVVGILVLRRRR